MSIKIPVQAEFSAASVEQQLQAFQQKLNSLGQQIAQANKTQFNPISKTSLQDMQRMVQQFEALRRVSTDLNKRINATGQKGKGFVDLDWGAMYPDAHSRARQQAKAWQYITGHAMVPPSQQPGRPGGGAAKPQGPSWVQQAGVNAVQAGLNAASGASGGVGGVAAGALGTGMSAGFGAGLMGLIGGMLALGVGKIVSAATEKIGQAEDNAVAYDKLKRVLGDVNVSFGALKSGIEGASSSVKITFDEAIRLGTQFAKLGNVTGQQASSIEDELRTGVGMSRSLGLDPSQGVGFLGTMRGIRHTQDEQGSRRIALLIGETIAKSNAFAKSDEVMEAISNYVTNQTRASGGANAAGYAGMYSAMVGSGIAGLDPASAAVLLGRISSTLSAGGGKGEASQFFTAGLGSSRGMDVFDTQLWREGGAFSTADKTFGSGAVGDFYHRKGLKAPTGDETLFDATRSEIERQYGSNPKMMLMAMANHLGINMSQAAMLDGLKGNQMGELEARLKDQGLKLGDINMGGLAALAKVHSGSGAERLGVASELWSRTGKDKLSTEEREALDKVMKEGTEDQQKDLLTQLVSSRDQEMTQGKDIRDSKTALENIKTIMADQLLPVTQAMRDGIMWMAGGKEGKSSQTIREDMAAAEIKEKYGKKISKLEADAKQAQKDFRDGVGPGTYADRYKRSFDAQVNAQGEIAKLKEQQRMEIEAKMREMRAEPTTPTIGADPNTPSGWRAGARLGSAPAGASSTNPSLANTRGYRNNNPGNLEATTQWAGMTGSDGRFAKFSSPEMGYRAMGKNLLAYQDKHGLNTVRGIISRWAPASENNTKAYIDKIAKELGVGPDDPLDLRDQQTLQRLMTGIARHENGGLLHEQDTIGRGAGMALGTPMPDDAASARKVQDYMLSFKGSFDPLAITLNYPDGKQASQQTYLNPYFKQPTPFGAQNPWQ